MTEADVGVALHALDEAAAAGSPSVFQSFVLMVMIVGIMYVVLFLPQQRERKRHEEMVGALKKDDRVITRGGLHGRVVSVAEGTVVLNLGDRTTVTVDKAAIADKAVEGGAAAPSDKK